MRVGHFVFGFLTPNFIAADGGYMLRRGLHRELDAQGHEIVWLASLRPAEQKYIDAANLKDVAKKDWSYNTVSIEDQGWKHFLSARQNFGKYEKYADKTNRWFKAEMQDKSAKWPDVDFVISDILSMGLFKYQLMSMISYYTNKHTPVFIWDKDCWGQQVYGLVNNHNDVYKVNKKYLYFLTPYSKQRFANQITMYYGYDRHEEMKGLATGAEANFVYVGNDYKRGPAMIRMYKDLSCSIYGNYSKDKEGIIPILGAYKFKGPVAPKDIVPTIHRHFACINVTRTPYANVGLHTSRLNETSYAGAICFIDSKIRDAEKFTLADQVVSNGAEADDKLEDILKHHEMPERVKRQREMLPTYKSQLPRVFEIVEKLRRGR